jgi:hypothetical protein
MRASRTKRGGLAPAALEWSEAATVAGGPRDRTATEPPQGKIESQERGHQI